MTSKSKAPATPVHSIRIGFITAAIWKNEDYFNVTITRAFKNSDGQWSDTHSFSHQDLPVVALLAEKAEAFISSQK